MKMNVQNITPTFTGNKYSIPCKGKNQGVYLMPNKLVDFVKENHLSAAFKTDVIEITPHKAKENPLNAFLEKLGVEFSKKAE